MESCLHCVDYLQIIHGWSEYLDIRAALFVFIKESVHPNYEKNPQYFLISRGFQPCRKFWFYLSKFWHVNLWNVCFHPNTAEVKGGQVSFIYTAQLVKCSFKLCRLPGLWCFSRTTYPNNFTLDTALPQQYARHVWSWSDERVIKPSIRVREICLWNSNYLESSFERLNCSMSFRKSCHSYSGKSTKKTVDCGQRTAYSVDYPEQQGRCSLKRRCCWVFLNATFHSCEAPQQNSVHLLYIWVAADSQTLQICMASYHKRQSR